MRVGNLRPGLGVSLARFFLCVCGTPLLAGNDVVPGALRVDSTYEHIGALWSIEGDNDLDSWLQMEFRLEGEAHWSPAAPAMRAHPALVVDGSPLGLNFWAASALFLEPGKAYELRLTMSDPDGGAETKIVSAATRKLPLGTFSGRHLYVVPGSSGGDGSSAAPFQGLQSAASNAVAGDVFHISPGTNRVFGTGKRTCDYRWKGNRPGDHHARGMEPNDQSRRDRGPHSRQRSVGDRCAAQPRSCDPSQPDSRCRLWRRQSTGRRSRGQSDYLRQRDRGASIVAWSGYSLGARDRSPGSRKRGLSQHGALFRRLSLPTAFDGAFLWKRCLRQRCRILCR